MTSEPISLNTPVFGSRHMGESLQKNGHQGGLAMCLDTIEKDGPNPALLMDEDFIEDCRQSALPDEAFEPDCAEPITEEEES